MSRRARFFVAVNSDNHRPEGGDGGSNSPVDDSDNYVPPRQFTRANKHDWDPYFMRNVALANVSSPEDNALRIRNILMLANTLLCLLLAFIMLQVEYDPSAFRLVQSAPSEAIKIIITILTVVVMLQIVEYYWRVVQFRKVEWAARQEKEDASAAAAAESGVPTTTIFPSAHVLSWADRGVVERRTSVGPTAPPSKASSPTGVLSQSPKAEEGVVTLAHDDSGEWGVDAVELRPMSDSAESRELLRRGRTRRKSKTAGIKAHMIVSDWTILRATSVPVDCFMELVVCVWHPFPGYGVATSKLALLMFLRLYMFWKVVRDFSSIYRKRRIIERIPGYSPQAAPAFNTFLTIKMLFFRSPIGFIMGSLLASGIVFSYCIFVFEREGELDELTGQPIFDFWIALYVVLTSFLTGWPTDVWDYYNPTTWPGKFVAMGSGIFGLFMFMLMIDYIHSRMQPSQFQAVAMEWVLRTEQQDYERNLAAQLIQIFWRHHRWKHASKLVSYRPDPLADQAEKRNFAYQWWNVVQSIRDHRREVLRDLKISGFSQPSRPVRPRPSPVPLPAVPLDRAEIERIVRDEVTRSVDAAVARMQTALTQQLGDLLLAAQQQQHALHGSRPNSRTPVKDS